MFGVKGQGHSDLMPHAGPTDYQFFGFCYIKDEKSLLVFVVYIVVLTYSTIIMFS